MSDCSGCSTYQKSVEDNKFLACFNAEWFAPFWIRYCRPQVMWYLVNCESIRDGKWPPEPEGSSYTDPSIRSKSVRVPARNAELLATEIDARLKKCGWREDRKTHSDGQSLIDEVENGAESYDDLRTYAARMALDYISGRRRRKKSYAAWLYEQQEKQRKKVTKTTF